jgi:flagellar biosynthesis protein
VESPHEPTSDLPRAVALRYAPRSGPAPASGAPEVLARGRGALAERILELAREHGVPVREDRDLVLLLSACEVGEEIPIEVWGAVAELLAWVYALRSDASRDAGAGAGVRAE